MEAEALKTRLNSALELDNWKINNAYKSVSVLAIYWEDGDVPGFEEEARQITHFFEESFNFDVDVYAIPSDHCHRKLDIRINAFLDDHGHQDDLIIIHYGGHGDPDNDTDTAQERLSVWTA